MNPITLLPNKADQIRWRRADGTICPFSTSVAWDSLRTQGQDVDWSRVIWSSFCRHSFNCWLIFRKKLWTQDRITVWQQKALGSMNMLCCWLWQKAVDSHDHLFFQRDYSKQVWYGLRNKGGMGDVPGIWDDIMDMLIPRARSKAVFSVIGRLLVAVVAYFIWQERNNRFFNNQLRPPKQPVEGICSTVWLKLHSFKFKRTRNVMDALRLWKIVEKTVLADT